MHTSHDVPGDHEECSQKAAAGEEQVMLSSEPGCRVTQLQHGDVCRSCPIGQTSPVSVLSVTTEQHVCHGWLWLTAEQHGVYGWDNPTSLWDHLQTWFRKQFWETGTKHCVAVLKKKALTLATDPP